MADDELPPQVMLEQGHRLSQSMLWQLQRTYYAARGIQAWRQSEVPQYVTTNPYIATNYARLVLGWLRDLNAGSGATSGPGQPALHPDQPLQILELGAGSGRFAFHFLKAFERLHAQSPFRDVPWRYVMTDLAEANVTFWSEHEWLQPFVAAGRLDFARFDADRDDTLQLRHSGEVLSAETLRNPLAVFANYVFDSIPQDAFAIQNGQLHESRVRLLATGPDIDEADPALISRVSLQWDHRTVDEAYYESATWNQVLQQYQERLSGTMFLFPTAALECLGRLQRLARGQMLVISCDRGDHREEALLGRGEISLTKHGSFSLPVNFHALQQVLEREGALVLQSSWRPAALNTTAFVFGDCASGYPETQLAYDDMLARFTPDDFYAIKKGLGEAAPTATPQALLAYLKLSGWDGNLFLTLFPALHLKVREAPAAFQQEMLSAIHAIWANYFPIGEDRSLPYHLGVLLYDMEFYPEAMQYFARSIELYGHFATTSASIGACLFQLRQFDDAQQWINQALQLDPADEMARRFRIQIDAALASR